MSRQKDLAKLDRLINEKLKEVPWTGDRHEVARKAVYKDILEGFRDLEEAKEHIEGMEDDRVIYTAQGHEITFSLIRIIIKHIEGNPRYSPWGEKPQAVTETNGRGATPQREFEILNIRGQRLGNRTFRSKEEATAFLEKKITAPPARTQFLIQEVEPEAALSPGAIPQTSYRKGDDLLKYYKVPPSAL